MIPAPFDYVRARSVDEALSLLGEHGEDAKVIAGGHSLLPMMKLRLARPEVLVDVAPIAELRYIRVDGDELAIGALSTHAQVAASDLVRTEAPLVAHSASLVGDPQVRHRGTLGGSLAHADPAADLPMAALAAGATLVVQGPAGRRTVAADDFFIGFFDTALEPGELLVEVRLPRRPGVGWGYEKFVRRANDWAIVGVATVGGRIALANMGSRPLRALAAEGVLAGGASIEEAAALAADGTEPVADLHADPEYRSHLARVLTARALASAAAWAGVEIRAV
jgi:carbon-monoxide dehydrogenase medium subunit